MIVKETDLQPKDFRKIPESSLVLPRLIEFNIPGFEAYFKTKGYVLSFKEIDSSEWYHEFKELVISKVESKEFFPVMRFSDGEYYFFTGMQFPLRDGHSLKNYLNEFASAIKLKYFNKKFQAATSKNVSSGEYTREEIAKHKAHAVDCLKRIAEKGVMALHLNYGQKPFQENYHQPMYKWLLENEISFDENNYYPFYFVYALLRGEARKQLLTERKILVVHSAKGEKREAIKKALLKEGAKSVKWCEISPNRSMFDKLDLRGAEDIDVAIIGAGVGKFNILSQLETLSAPCIDAGFVFEVWADESKKFERTLMIPDLEREN